MHRGIDFSLSQKQPYLFPRKGELRYTSCLERTQHILVLTKDLAWDKIKSSLNKQTKKKKSVNIQQQEGSRAVSPKHSKDCLASYRFMRLTIIITTWNTRTLKVTKTSVTAGMSRHCFWKGRFYLSGKSSKMRKRRHALQHKKGAASSVWGAGN